MNKKSNQLGIIYMLTCEDTGKSYIGQTIHPRERFKAHLIHGIVSDGQTDFKRAMDAYRHWTYKVLETDIPRDELNKAEQYYIKLFDTYHNGYNMTKGGDTWGQTHGWSEHRRKAIEKSWTAERRKQSSEQQHIVQTLYFQSERGKQQAENHSKFMKGKCFWSDETKELVSSKLKAVVHTEEWNNKVSAANKGKKLSDEHKRKLSESHKGNRPGNYGKHFVWNDPTDRTKGFHYE